MHIPRLALVPCLIFPGAAVCQPRIAADTFSLEQVLSYPYPMNLVAAPTGGRIAWVFDQGGRRNIWMAEPPGYKAKQVTHYSADDGQELTNLAFTPDGTTLIFVRGGDHDANWNGDGAPNPASSPKEPKVAIFSVPANGGEPRRLTDGDLPVVSPRGDRVVFTKDRQLWVIALGDSAAPTLLFYARGTSGSATWSPDGAKLAFVSDRDDHSFVGVYETDSTPIRWLAPSTSRDAMPQWSPDGSRIAFVRLAGQGSAPEPLLAERPVPWAIWTADVATGAGRKVWQSPNSLRGSYPETDGEANLHWAAGDRLVFLSDQDGWPHIYSVPVQGGAALLLTPGRSMAEFISLSPDKKFLVYAANVGPDSNDMDRRHIVRVPVDRAAAEVLTPGAGVEWSPVFTADSRTIAFIAAGATTPPLPAVMPSTGGPPLAIGSELVPPGFPGGQLVVPKKAVFRSPDGLEIHGQLFQRADGAAKKPAVVFVHGGPPRQMLLGWHYMDYYSHAYAINQYLANHGYVVMSVNYRLGIGYGHEFHHPAHAGPWGESEYQDVRAGGQYLRALPGVDSTRVGIWGGSYGGLLTALALARDSRLFKTGVDLHGVHDWPTSMGMWENGSDRRPYEPNDSRTAMQVAWKSSPVADVARWKSPVLLIQGDDDRNVRFHQTVDLARRLSVQGVRFEELVLPDEIHGFLRHSSWLVSDHATVDWFNRELKGETKSR